MDLISSLPNPLISHILSFLSTKEAASTSVLSKRWRLLFALVSNLNFDDSVYQHSRGDEYDEESSQIPTIFMEFVDRVLALQENSTVNKLSLSCRYGVDPDRVAGWILNVLGRGVTHLDLNLLEFESHLPNEIELPLPSEIFLSKTLVKLKLGDGDRLTFTSEIGDVSLPKLKSLHLDAVGFEEGEVGFVKLLSCCPVLEELVLINIVWNYWKSCSISITTLKRVTFSCEDMDENPRSVSFDTPNLVYLEYTDTIANKYPKINFGSVKEAHIGLRLTEDDSAEANYPEYDYFSGGYEKIDVGNATEVFMGICNVQTLSLTFEALEVLTFCCDTTPVFNNLIHLTIESTSDVGWKTLPALLKNSPNLETLVFKGLNHRHTDDGCVNMCYREPLKNPPSCLSSSPVKVLKVYMGGYMDYDRMETWQMKHFLERMPRLEQLIVYYNTSYNRDVYQLSKMLQKIQKIASPMCQIQVISKNLTLSSTLPSLSKKKKGVLAL